MLEVHVKATHEATRHTYGHERLHTKLEANGVVISTYKVRTLRQRLGLFCRQKKRYKCTTNSNHSKTVAPNLLEQNFTVTRPNQAWVSLHSDRGNQYCAKTYQQKLIAAGIIASMSRRGNCYDNAPMEIFWGSLKNELIHQKTYLTRQTAIDEIVEYIEIFYAPKEVPLGHNRKRRHTSLGNISPAQALKQFKLKQEALV